MDPVALGELISALVPFVPLAAIHWLLTALTVVGIASTVGAVVKPWLGDPTPSDARWKRVGFKVLHVLDYVAVNTPTIRSKLAAANSIPPPKGPPPIPPGAITMLVLGLVLSGCAGTSSLQRQASAAELVEAPALSAIHDAIAGELAADDADIKARIPDGDERKAAQRAMLQKFGPLLASYQLLSDAFYAYVAAIDAAAKDGGKLVAPSLQTSLAFAWDELHKAADLIHVPIPEPADLLSLIGGAR